MKTVTTVLRFPGINMNEETLIQVVEHALDKAEMVFDLDVADSEVDALKLTFLHVTVTDEELIMDIERAIDKAGIYCDVEIDLSVDEIPDDKIVDQDEVPDDKPEVTISYPEAVERAQQGTLPTCPHLEKVKVFKACYTDCIQYVFGTECNLPDGWEVEELGYLSYINMTNKDENLQRMIDEYMDGDAGSCREDCEHYKSCNE